MAGAIVAVLIIVAALLLGGGGGPASPSGGGASVGGDVLPFDVSSLIDQYSAQYGVDPNLARAVAVQESGGDQTAVSSKGAIGVMQLEPATAAGLGVDPYSLQGNIQGGVKYLSQLLNQFGDPSLAIAAYNAGPGRVQSAGGIPNIPETQNYVTNVLGLYNGG